MNNVPPSRRPGRADGTPGPPSDRPPGRGQDGHGLTLRIDRPDATTTVLTVTGEIDLVTCGAWSSALTAATSGAAGHQVVVELTGVRFLAACAVAALVEAHHIAERRRVCMRVVIAPTSPEYPTVARVLGWEPDLRLHLPEGDDPDPGPPTSRRGAP